MQENKFDIRYAATFNSIKKTASKNCEYKLSDLSIGINFTDNHIIRLSSNNQVEWVISRVCDHASGTLEPCAQQQFAECPLHGWKLDLEKLKYSNVNVAKETLDFQQTHETVIVHELETHLNLPDELSELQSEHTIDIRFISHACLLFNFGNIKLITDPWLKGPCFLNSWWHKPAPSDDALEQLLSADLVYISHNHPDHMHEETLQYLYQHRPDMPIIIPNFKTKSTETPIRHIGFKNVHPLIFNQIFEINNHKLFISILKSGDFRDDSGLYVSYGKKQALLTVDSSALNHYHLPMNIDILATSFAGGASGHPWCFNHYSEDEKLTISSKRRQSVKNSVNRYVEACQPKAYMPYAGYFSEDAPRDSYIKSNNKKNSLDEIEQLLLTQFPTVEYINPILTDQISLAGKVSASHSQVNRQANISQQTINNYVTNETIPHDDIFYEHLIKYFKDCGFSDNLILYLIPCFSDFKQYDRGLIIDFHDLNNITCNSSHEVVTQYQSNHSEQRALFIEVRASLLWQVIDKGKSWEELSIGFHCRIHRKPDVYNSDFWYHFSNIYIK